mgnify:CR=1 FL=1
MVEDSKIPVEGARAAPPPAQKQVTTVRLYQEDIELLRKHYPEGLSLPIRRVVRRFCDRLRKDNGQPVKGQPKE